MAAAMTLPSEPQRSIFERAVCLSVTFRAMGTRRKVSSAHVEIDADKDPARPGPVPGASCEGRRDRS